MGTGSRLAARGHLALVTVEPVGGRWRRLDTSSGSTLVRAEPGVRLDHDRAFMRITTRDRGIVVVSGVDPTAETVQVHRLQG